jgi:hypothetical protein
MNQQPLFALAKTWMELENQATARVRPIEPTEVIAHPKVGEVPAGWTLERTLILMACSATKRDVGDALPHGVPLSELYDGPTWQTLRVHMGTDYPRNVVVLSGGYGIVPAGLNVLPYEARLSAEKAHELIRRGILERQGDRMTPLAVMHPPAAGPWQGVIVCAGASYRRVFLAMLQQLRQWGALDPLAPLLVTRGGIGEQRSQLGRWVDQLRANPFQAAA